MLHSMWRTTKEHTPLCTMAFVAHPVLHDCVLQPVLQRLRESIDQMLELPLHDSESVLSFPQ